MSNIIKLADSNWELVAFALIKKIVGDRYSLFERTELFKQDNIDYAVSLLEALGHKKDPQRPEESLQSTIQKMRDKKYIDFRGSGSYRLTPQGRDTMEKRLSSDEWKLALAVISYQASKK